jgi:hypothetical protein
MIKLTVNRIGFLIKYVNRIIWECMVQNLLSKSVCKHVNYYAFEELIEIMLHLLVNFSYHHIYKLSQCFLDPVFGPIKLPFM